MPKEGTKDRKNGIRVNSDERGKRHIYQEFEIVSDRERKPNKNKDKRIIWKCNEIKKGKRSAGSVGPVAGVLVVDEIDGEALGADQREIIAAV